jgi:hypothetical protein
MRATTVGVILPTVIRTLDIRTHDLPIRKSGIAMRANIGEDFDFSVKANDDVGLTD